MNQFDHQSLANIIKGVHRKLRISLKETCNPDEVWSEHLKDENLRKEYSQAMYKLATEVWSGKESRIEWTYKTCINYFFNGGLERSLLREMKLQKLFLEKQNLSLSAPKLDILQNNYMNFEGQLNLLDVGSCYNPFSQFEEFCCTAIDLTPATKDVLQCDFLSVEIKSKKENVSIDSKSSVTFYEEDYDIVVLSLVLEYLPASKQRTVFCYKSWQLLKENGLCIIITPDSKSVNHNSCMMKSWKLALEKLGFIRVKYDKLKHIHCMAFRKSRKDFPEILQWDSISELLYIPQDFTTYSHQENVERNDEENCHISNNFLALPNEDLF